jgi:hypothetical protein
MERFTKEIEVGKETRLFEFTMMKNVNGEKFFITTKDANKKPVSCSVRQKEAKEWKLIPGSHRWLYEIESQLSDAIIDTRLS